MVLSPLLAAGFLVAATAAPASAADSVSLQGVVTAELGGGGYAPQPGIQVSLYSLSGSGDIAYSTPSSDGGAFTLYAQPGRYRIHFESNNCCGANSAATWLGNTPYEAQSQIVEVGAVPLTGLNAQLEIGSTLSGVISFAESTNPQAAAAVFLYDYGTGEYERFGYRAVADANGAYTIPGLPAGTYTLRFGDPSDQALVSTVYWEDSDFIFASTPVEVAADQQLTGFDATVGPGGVWMSRLFGADRFATSVQISQAGYQQGSDEVFIVNGMDFPDALSAGPAAARIGAPILLTMPAGMTDSVMAELARLAPTTIYIVGGTPSVSIQVENQLRGYTTDVIRFNGADRFETSRLVADYFWGGSDNRTAYLATGMNFPDALSAAPAAANEYAPVILVNGGLSTVDSGTKTLLDELDIEKVVIAGGEPSVSAGLKKSIDELPFILESYRRNGADRFATSLITNQKSFPLADAAFLATGYSFPDALAGAALAGSWFAPIYLVPQVCVPLEVLEEIGRLHVRDLVLLGGEPSLSDDVMNLIPC
ncbi:cell wall-binding repeat-containing protein [Agromyces albus]|uniref:cell wall-binding repeat-containing protein n=1 Tax=Agromyces albus TaxID=205332 RepID=UPI00278A76D1|nr:cell wall-binding repeat-containing protein [Agromyces albus]MDQ0576544.1 putative cell wall-binding protein [Agromyces albus]